MLEFDDEYSTDHLKIPILTFVLKHRENAAVKHFIEKHVVCGNTFLFLTGPTRLQFTISVDFRNSKDPSALKIDI